MREWFIFPRIADIMMDLGEARALQIQLVSCLKTQNTRGKTHTRGKSPGLIS